MRNIVEKAYAFYREEFETAILYHYLAQSEKDNDNKAKFMQLYAIEASHVKFWFNFLKRRGFEVKPKKNAFKLALEKIMRRVLGIAIFASLLEMGESTSVEAYSEFLLSEDLSEDERESLKKIIEEELDHETFFENQKNVLPVNNVRDFILGMNDGLVELLGAVTGLSAVYPSNPLFVGINGLVVGLAGALSMAIGSFISVRSQRQVNEGIAKKMGLLFSVSKSRAKQELLNKLVDSGIPKDAGQDVIEKIGENEDAVMNLLIEKSDENEVRSAIFTGLAYIVGVAFPVLPYFLLSSSLAALALSIALAGLALATVAGIVSITAGNPNVKGKIVEMVLSGFGAAAVSYVFGLIVQAYFGISA